MTNLAQLKSTPPPPGENLEVEAGREYPIKNLRGSGGY